jgi:cytochrome c oxidase cbb3-type subunit III
MNAVRCTFLAATLAVLGGCQRSQGGSTPVQPVQAAPDVASITAVPLGDVAGGQKVPAAALQKNPWHENPEAIAEGQRLFTKMNCAGCHGYGATGGMGPNLTDNYWRYGGTPVQIFKSIYEGRPQGMPAWNPALPPDEIWKLVAYIQSLGGSFPAESFEASVQGDRAQMTSAPESPSPLPPGAPAPKPKGEQGRGESAAKSPPEARPDAGGKP